MKSYSQFFSGTLISKCFALVFGVLLLTSIPNAIYSQTGQNIDDSQSWDEYASWPHESDVLVETTSLSDASSSDENFSTRNSVEPSKFEVPLWQPKSSSITRDSYSSSSATSAITAACPGGDGLPCLARRWTAGDGWDDVSGCATCVGNGIIDCANAAATQSNIGPNTTYCASNFEILGDLTKCLDPDASAVVNPISVTPPIEGQPILWFNFDVRAFAESSEFQIIGGPDNIAWALYYSDTPTESNLFNGTNGMLSGDCTNLVFDQCGSNFTGWAPTPFDVPRFPDATNYYVMVWDQDATKNYDFSIVFKARYGCGNTDFCALEQDGAEQVSCNSDGLTYSVTVDVNGINGTYSGVDANANTISSDLCLTNPTADPMVTTGSITFTYDIGEPYNISIERISDCGITVTNGSECALSGISGSSPTDCCTPSVTCKSISDIDIEGCADDIPAAITDPSSIFDYTICGSSVVTMTSNDAGDIDFCSVDGDGYDFIRTYTLLLDGVAQSPTCEQNIIIQDTEAPLIECPTDIIDLGCTTDPPTGADALAAVITKSDNCGVKMTVANGGTITGDCQKTQVFTVSVSDYCNRTASCDITFTWNEDTENPVITDIADYTLEGCNTDWPVISFNWTDACGVFSQTSGSATASPGDITPDGCFESRTYSVTVTDNCGNPSSESVIVTRKVDESAPSIAPIADYTLDGCNTPWPTVVFNWTDACGVSSQTSGSATASPGDITPDGCFESRTYSVTVTDDCGNPSSESVTVTRKVDETAPSITPIPDYTLDGCNTSWPTVVFNWTDACGVSSQTSGSATASPGDITLDGCFESRIYSVTITDDCGNPSSESATVTRKVDETAPSITPIADYTLDGCNTSWPTVVFNWTDACGVSSQTSGSATASPGDITPDGCFESRIYSVTITDDCGNPSSESVTVTRKVDETAPSITPIADYTLDGCNTSWPTVVFNWTDACGVSSQTSGSATASPGDITPDGCFESRIYSVTITDDCGNPSSESVTVTRKVDETAPSITPIADYTLDGCNTPWPTVVFNWTDACGVSSQTSGSATASPGDITPDGCFESRTYSVTVTDDCGNPSSESVTVTRKVDESAPSITPIADYTLDGCNTAWPTVVFNWTNTCGGSQTTGTATASPGDITPDGCFESRTYSVTVTDDCGNPSSESVIVTRKVDESAPSITPIADYTLDGCNTPWPTVVFNWTDACGVSSQTSGSATASPGDITPDGCFESRTYSVTITDDCGNPSSESVIVTRKVDETAPSITSIADYTLEGCNSPWPAISFNWTDACGVNSLVSGSALATPGQVAVDGCFEYRTYSVTITDDCGNPSSESVIVTRKVDETAPSITSIADYTLEGCNSPWPAISFNWTDACGVNSLVSGSALATLGQVTVDGCFEYRTYSVTITDDCGNPSSESVIVTRKVDETAPSITPIADYTLEGCNSPWPAISFNWTDACGVNSLVSGSALATPGQVTVDGCFEYRTYSVTITDDCGNPSSESVIVTRKVDETAPSITPIADYTLEGCNSPWPAISFNWTDACGVNSLVSGSALATPGQVTVDGCFEYRTYSVTITDDCGNPSSESVIVTRKVDETAPSITPIADYTLEGCNSPWPAISFNWTDACGVNSLVSGSALATPGQVTVDGCFEYRTYSVTITDDCGNPSSESVIVTRKVDETAPSITPIADYTLEGCNSPWPAISFNWTDACGVNSLVSGSALATPGQVALDGCFEYRTYSVTITDDCGNPSSESVIVTRKVDETAPSITPIADYTLEGCNSPWPAISFNWTDACGVNSLVSGSALATPGQVALDGCFEYRTYSVTITDDCGNPSSESVIVTRKVDESIPVIFTEALNRDLGCNPTIVAPTFTVTDNCDGGQIIEDEGEPQRTDDFNSVDLNPTSQILLDNGDLIPVVVTVGPTAGEDCSFSQTWTANYTDACGNIAETVTVTYTWTEDTDKPVITPISEGGYLGCNPLEIPVPMFNVSDNCMDADITIPGIPGDIVRSEGDECLVTQIWTANYTDDCENIAEAASVTYTWREPLEDLAIGFVNPMLIEVGDGGTLQIQCFGQNPEWSLPEASLNDVTISGGCGVVVPSVSEIKITDGECVTDGFIQRFLCSWSAIDECDNEVSLSIIMEVVDEIPPIIFGVPENVTVNCDAIPDAPTVTATDECLCADIEMTESAITEECLDGQVITRTWTASDCCGNVTVETQTITLTDKQAPQLVVSLPTGLDIKDNIVLDYDCNDGGIPDIFSSLSAENAAALEGCSGEPTISFASTFTVNNGCSNGVLNEEAYTWTAVDACGNAKSIVLTLRTIDTTPPQIVGLEDKVCEADMPFIYAVDNCTTAFMEFFDQDIDGGCGNEFLRTYYAYDQCGNSMTATQIIIGEDNTAPEIELINPLVVNAESGDTIKIEQDSQLEGRYTNFGNNDANYIDECGNDLVTSFNEEILLEAECDDEQGIAFVKVTWTATDYCGNVSTSEIFVSIVDTQAPVLVDFEPEISVSCSKEVPEVRVRDNAGIPTITVDEIIIPGDCPGNYQIERSIFAEDACGNSVSATQMVTVVDQVGPVISGVEAFMCEDLSIPEVTALDDCSSESLPVTMVQDTISNEDCTNEILIRRIWSATDLCGNTTEVEQVISFNDDTAPELIYVEEIKPFVGKSTEVMMSDLNTIALIEEFDWYSITSLDRCPGQVLRPEFTYESALSEDCAAEGFYEKRNYTWVFTDACGNVSTEEMEIVIVDDVAPILINLPLDEDYGCNGIPLLGNLSPPEFAEVMDSMTGSITFTEVELTDETTTTITNTYTAVDMCGNVTVVQQLLSAIVESDIACSISSNPNILCNSHGNVLTANVTGGEGPYTYEWEIEGKDCQIQAGQNTKSIKIYVGFSDVKVTLLVTDSKDCVTECEIDISCISKGQVIDARTINTKDANEVKITTLMPNPASEKVTFTVHSETQQNMNYSLVNMMNQRILTNNTTLEVGENSIDLNINEFESGIYYILVENDESSDIKRFIKVR